MSIKLSRQAWDTSSQRGARLLLLVALADNANDDGWAWPSIPTLAKKSRMSERYVQVMLKEIEVDGEISIHIGEGSNGVNLYHVHPGVYRSWPRKEVNHTSPPDESAITRVMNPDPSDGVNHTSPLVKVHPVNHASPPDESLITGVVNPDALDGEAWFTGVVNPNAPKRSWNPQGTIMEPPPPTPVVNSGPFDSAWDPGEAAEAAYYARAGDDSDSGDSEEAGWGGGGDTNHDWENIPASVPPLIERAKFDQLVDTGGTWDADQYEHDATNSPLPEGGGNPGSAPPHAANDISWPECEKALRKLDVLYPSALRTIGLPYTVVLKKAKSLSREGARGGAILKWFRTEGNVESLRTEANNLDPLACVAAAPPPPTGAEILQQRPAWCSAAAWKNASAALQIKLQSASLQGGWLHAENLYKQKFLDGKYRADIIAILQQSDIQPTPPPPVEFKMPSAPSAWRAA